MFTLFLFSLVLGAKDFESLTNDYTNCPVGDEVDDQNYENKVLFYHNRVDECFMITRTNGIFEVPGTWKTYPVPGTLPTSYTITPDPTNSNDPGVTNTYGGNVFKTLGYLVQVLDALYMTVARHDGVFPGKTISIMGTFYGINHIGRRVVVEGTQRRTVEYMSKVLVPADTNTADTEGLWMLWYGGAQDFGLIDTGCVLDSFDSLPEAVPLDANYKCTTGETSRTIDSQRFAKGYHLVHVNDVSNAEIKKIIIKYGPSPCGFQLNRAAFESGYYNKDGAERPAYAIPTAGAIGNCFLVYGWDSVAKRDGDPDTSETVQVWKVKYLYDNIGYVDNSHNPYGLLKMLKTDPGVNTLDSSWAAYFVKDCTDEPCGTCAGAGCTCITDCFDCEAVTGSDTTGCTCGTEDHATKCAACPAGANNATCRCDGTVNCADCVTPANSNCTCTALCSTCAEGTDKDECDPDPPPDDAAFGVKVTLLLALLAVFFAL